MENSGNKELYGLIGHPVKHSFSEVMHNAAFEYCGINARYQLFDVLPENLEKFFKNTVVEKNIRGFNITVPHKEKSISFLNGSISQSVRMNKAVNTVRREKDGVLSGFNTDGPGFYHDIKEQGLDLADKAILLLGAGGGAKSVATSIAARNPKKIAIFDIDIAKVKALKSILFEFFPLLKVVDLRSLDALDIAEANILINATPVGLNENDPLLVKKEWLHKDLFVYDLIYNPAQTQLLKTASEAGCRTSNGLGMLLYQGALAFEYWTGEEAPVSIMRKALEESIKKV
jgi:shikimate dehydrogenase